MKYKKNLYVNLSSIHKTLFFSVHLQTGYYSKHDVYNAFPHSFLYTTEMRLVCILPKSVRLEGFLTYDSSIRNSRSKIQQEKTTCEKTETLPSVSSDQSSPTTFSTRKVRLCRLRRTCSLAGYWQRETGSVCEREGSVKLFVCVYMWPALLARRQDEKGIWAVMCFL